METGLFCIKSVLAPEHDELKEVQLFLWQSSVDWMSDKIKRFFVGVGRRHPVKMRMASLWACQ